MFWEIFPDVLHLYSNISAIILQFFWTFDDIWKEHDVIRKTIFLECIVILLLPLYLRNTSDICDSSVRIIFLFKTKGNINVSLALDNITEQKSNCNQPN